MNNYRSGNSLARAICFLSERSCLTEVKTHSIYTKPIGDGYVVVDLGANIGQFTEEMNERFGCICYAIEPIPELYSQIKTNESIRKYNFAISENGEPLKLFVSTNRECHSVHEQVAASYGCIVEVSDYPGVTLDRFVKDSQIPAIDLLKVDIEGAERELFRSTSDEFLRSVEQITIEFHDFVSGSISRDEVLKICERLECLGFYCIPFSFLMPEAETADFLFLNMNKLRVSLQDRVRFALIKKGLQAQRFKAHIKRRVAG